MHQRSAQSRWLAQATAPLEQFGQLRDERSSVPCMRAASALECHARHGERRFGKEEPEGLTGVKGREQTAGVVEVQVRQHDLVDVCTLPNDSR